MYSPIYRFLKGDHTEIDKYPRVRRKGTKLSTRGSLMCGVGYEQVPPRIKGYLQVPPLSTLDLRLLTNYYLGLLIIYFNLPSGFF